MDKFQHFIRCADSKTGLRHFLTHYYYVPDSSVWGSKFQPDATHSQFADMIVDSQCSVWDADRAEGKTAMCIGYLMWRALFFDNETLLLVIPNMNQLQHYRDRIMLAYSSIEEEFGNFLPKITKSVTSNTVFDSNSCIMIRSDLTTVRGYSFSSIVLDDQSDFHETNGGYDLLCLLSPAFLREGKLISTGSMNPLSSGHDGFRALCSRPNVSVLSKRYDTVSSLA